MFHIILMVLRRMNKRKKWGEERSSLSRNTRQLFTSRGSRREREMNSSKWKATTATKRKNNPAARASGLETEQRGGGGCACGSFLCTMSTPASCVLESRGTRDYYGEQYTTQSQTQARSSFLPSAKAGATKPACPWLVVRQGHQMEWSHLHPGGSIAAFLHAPSIFSLLYSTDFIDSISQIVLWMSLYLAWWKILPGFFWWEVLLLALFDFQKRLFLTKILQFHKFICYLINIIKCLFDKSNKHNKMPFQ